MIRKGITHRIKEIILAELGKSGALKRSTINE